MLIRWTSCQTYFKIVSNWGVNRKLGFITQKPIARAARLMSFCQKYNPVTGKLEWEMQDENYDFQQEIARSGYADMVHDTERNQKYYDALKTVISGMKQNKIPIRVLDIGTGTGLLSMMAVKCGADTVIACEAFNPMAKCAVEVVKKNVMQDKIKIINKRSTELTVGPGCDLETKCNVLVTEVFDTELIGEGALSTFKHACKFLLEPNSKIIPSIAKVYIQIVESPLIMNWHRGLPINITETELINVPKEVQDCPGLSAVHDIQMNQLRETDFKALSEPIIVNYFDFTKEENLIFNESCLTKANAIASGECQAVLMWWDLEMTPAGDVLSCAPYWAHPNKNAQWRDHWMQAIYYFPKTAFVKKGECFQLGTHHDEYSYWFNIHSGFKKMKPIRTEAPRCVCGLHASYSRTRIGMLNDKNRNILLARSLKKLINNETVCFCLGESMTLSILAAKLNAKRVYICEPNNMKRKLLFEYIKSNGVENQVTVLEKDVFDVKADDLENSNEISLVLGEPWFSSSVLPWDNIHFWYLKSSLRKLLRDGALVNPVSAVIKGIGVQFEDLYKIRAPVGNDVEGFDLVPFDELIKGATDISDPALEPHPLWEYPCKALTEPFEIMSFDFGKDIDQIQNETVNERVLFQCSGICNAVALWVEYKFVNETFSIGPCTKVIPGENVDWYRYSHQAVHFIEKPQLVENITLLNIEATFKPKDGDMSFKFQIL